ncbi:unnamed protein product [Acanthosepion pharaonis]|uniref:Uncharacterized protein n=1 Tax=Acanthosepion pharaonis TaxID=158019 RepID=A0A812D9M0_ACAPH|nr:unnamed protein product [Sepia pharaonis]
MSAIHRQEDGQELIKVGNLYLIWKETSEQKASSPMQSAQSQAIFPDVQQRINSPNYNPVTLPNTVTRSGNRRSTFARAINTHPQLEIRGTTVSRSIDNIYQSSNISSFYRKCSVLSIKPDPPSVTFRLVFTHKQSKVPSDIIQVLEHRAPQLNKNGKSVLHVGDLFLVWRNYSLVLSTTPEGQAGTSMWAAGNNPPVSVGSKPVRVFDCLSIIPPHLLSSSGSPSILFRLTCYSFPPHLLSSSATPGILFCLTFYPLPPHLLSSSTTPAILFRLTCYPLPPHLLSSSASPDILFRLTCYPLPPHLLSSSASPAILFRFTCYPLPPHLLSF